MAASSILLTGATGLVGGEVLSRMLQEDGSLEAFVLVRSRDGWAKVAERLGTSTERVTPLEGDITKPGLNLRPEDLATVSARVDLVIHAAADTTFSQPLEHARLINVTGTRHTLEEARAWPGVRRFVYVSTAFVVGRTRGPVPETVAQSPEAGWVNAYEQSKHEAECLVRGGSLPWVIFRPSTIVCDGIDGRVSQFNAVHRALHLYYAGLASLMPGDEDTPVDVVTNEYVAGAIAELAGRAGIDGETFHLCAGGGALPLGELLDTSYAIWSESPGWRERQIPRPALADLATYRLFERTVEETGDARIRTITRSLSYFVPQLAHPKRFDTSRADEALGRSAPPVRDYWTRMLRHLVATRWAASVRRAG